MARLQIEQRLETMGGQQIFHVILPEQGDLTDAPVVWLLHGAADNGTGWLRYSAVERYAYDYGAVLVVPNVGNTWYTDMAMGVRAFTCVTQELPSVCRRMFGLSAKRERNYVLGLSMGGYGALKLALSRPQCYCACGALSAAVHPERSVYGAGFPMPSSSAPAVFGSAVEQGHLAPQDDLWQLARQAASAEVLPDITLLCGQQDTLLEANEEFHAFLQKNKIAHSFDSAPGAHTWAFWDAAAKSVMEHWFAK